MHARQRSRTRPIDNPAVAAVFAAYPPKVRRRLMVLRQLIFDTAAITSGVGDIEESLKWGQPAYSTPQTKSGTTIRVDWKKSTATEYAMYFHCQTTLVDSFRTLFPRQFKYEGNRAIVFNEDERVPLKELSYCVVAALTYHRSKPTVQR